MYLDARHPSLKDRVAFVTAGASGIGADVAERFRDQGARRISSSIPGWT